MTLVLFDMDGVLNHYEYEWRQGELARLAGLEITEFKRLWLESGWEDAAEAGTPSTGQAYLEGFNEILGSHISIDQWLDIRKVAMRPNHKTLDLAKRLSQNHTIAILTNNGALLHEHIDDLAPELRPIFGKYIYASSEFSARKPDAEIFHRCLAAIGAKMQDTVFIDDSDVNAKGAENAGLQAIHFTPDMDLGGHPLIAGLLN
jgi:putative hydrolase of the HAD superfamily